jgi:segregation and condensation protein A
MTDAFNVKNEKFDGPLDLLLSLIQERKLYINEISLAHVTDAYLSYLERCPELPISETAQFVLVASTLLLIKSRSLLPNLELTDEEEFQIVDLEKRLALYRLIKAGAKEISKVWGTSPEYFSYKSPESENVFVPSADITLTAIVDALKKLVLELPQAAFSPTATVRPVVSLEAMILKLEERIATATRSRFSDFVRGAHKEDRVVQFLALLELVRRGKVLAEQHERFGDIIMEPEGVSVPVVGA